MSKSQVNLRLENGLIDQLDTLAKTHNRSRNNLIETLIEQGVAALRKIDVFGGPLEAAEADKAIGEFDAEIEQHANEGAKDRAAYEFAAAQARDDDDSEPVLDRSDGHPKRHLHHFVEVEGSRSMSMGQEWATFECECGKSQRRKT